MQSKGLSRVFSNTIVHSSESQPDENLDLSLPASRSMGQQLSLVFSQKVAVSYTEVLENEYAWLTDTSLQFLPLSPHHLLLCVSYLLISLSLTLFFFLIWSLIVFKILLLEYSCFQCCVSFCSTTTWISCMNTYIPSLLSPLRQHPHPTPLGHHRAPG